MRFGWPMDGWGLSGCRLLDFTRDDFRIRVRGMDGWVLF
jgi:hypothetical protein